MSTLPEVSSPSTATPRSRTGGHTGSAAALAVMSLLGNVLGYLFFLILNRTQSASDVGVVTAILNLTIVTGVPALAAQLVSARRAAQMPRHPEAADLAAVARGSLRTGVGLGTLFTVLVVALAPVLHQVLRLSSLLPALLLAATLPATGALFGVQGFLQGRRRFAHYGVLTVVSTGTRVVAALLAAHWGLAADGVLLLTVVAAWLTAGVAMGSIRGHLHGPATPGERSWMLASLHASASTAVVIVVANLDAPLARHLLSGVEAGEYAVLSLFTKAAFWGPAFLATFFFPVMARSASLRHALAAIGATAGIAVLGVGAGAVFAEPLIALVGGASYRGLASAVPLFIGVGALWSVGQVVVYWGLARGEQASGYAAWLAVAVVIVAALLIEHPTALVIASLLIGGAALHVCLGLGLLVWSRVRPPVVAVPPPGSPEPL